MHNKYKKYCTIHNTDTVAYATHSGNYSTECKKEVHLLHTGTHVVHNNYSGTQHMHDTETFRLPERQVASTMISVLILYSRHFNISVLRVVVRGHYVNVKTEQTFDTLQPRN